MNAPLRGGKSRRKPNKQAYYVRVSTPDDRTEFIDATAHLGKKLPVTKPQAAASMQVDDTTVVFTLQHLTKKAVAGFLDKPATLPRGPLNRLAAKAAELAVLEPGQVVVEIGDERNGEPAIYPIALSVDPSGVATVEVPVGFDAATNIELPGQALRARVFFKSPTVGRVLGVGFIGHVGKPGGTETAERVCAKILNAMSGLAAFRILAGFDTVSVPASPMGHAAVAVRRAEEQVFQEIPVYLFSGDTDPQPVASGSVMLQVDLDNANPTTGRLLYHLTPDAGIAEVFEDYRKIFDDGVTSELRRFLGDELAAITYDVVLGEVSSGTVERIREALATVAGGLNLTPTLYMVHTA